MSYKMLKYEVDRLVDHELDMANRDYRHFSSDHEGESVIREEWTEAEAEIVFCRQWLDEITRAVFRDDPDSADLNAEELHKQAIYLACEAIQLAAMAKKFQESRKLRVALRPSCSTCKHFLTGHHECVTCDADNSRWELNEHEEG